jgi:hypothetical protein
VSEEDMGAIEQDKSVYKVAVCCGESIKHHCPLADDHDLLNCLHNTGKTFTVIYISCYIPNCAHAMISTVAFVTSV